MFESSRSRLRFTSPFGVILLLLLHRQPRKKVTYPKPFGGLRNAIYSSTVTILYASFHGSDIHPTDTRTYTH